MNRIARFARSALLQARRHGVAKSLYVSWLKALGYRRWFRVLRGHCVEHVNTGFLEVPPSYAAGFVAPRNLEPLTQIPDAGISQAFLQEAAAKGDKCYGFTHSAELVSHTWWATNPTRVTPELKLHFRRDYVYMYKGFTRERHRGRRLYAVGITRALRQYRALGYRGMLCYVDATNLDSMKSCARVGMRIFGSLYVVKFLGRRFVYASPGCTRFEFRLAPAEERRPDAASAAPRGVWARRVR